MRPIAFAALMALVPSMAPAQQETLLSDVHFGGYGGPIARVTEFAGHTAALVGGRGALLVNGTWGLGFSGLGWSDAGVRGRDGGYYRLHLGYGGVTFEYINRTLDLVHVATELTTAAGGASQSPPGGPWRHHDDAFLVVEPGVTLEVNVARTFRIGAGATYRMVSGIDLPAFADGDIQGASFVVVFKFGRFNSGARR